MSSELHDLIEKELQAADVRIEAGARGGAPARADGGGSSGGNRGLAHTVQHPRDALRRLVESVHLAANRLVVSFAGARAPGAPGLRAHALCPRLR
jgi:hypothetical protein